MSWKFCQELDDFLSNEWIKVADICAIFAGWIPISPYIPDYSYERGYGPRMYLRLEDGKRVTPGQEGFKEIIRIQKKWSGSSWDFTTRYSNVVDHGPMNGEIRVRDAFKIGLAMKVDRVALIFDAAVEQGIVADIVAAPKTEIEHHHHHSVQVSGVEGEGEVGEIEKPKHKFEVGRAKASMTKVLVHWLTIIRDQGDEVPEGEADKFLKWFADNIPAVPFIKIEQVTADSIKFWNINDAGQHIDKSAKTYDKNQINIQIKRLCGLK